MITTVEIALFLLFGAALTVMLSSRLALPLEVLLPAASLAISLVPDLPRVALEPELVFLVFLPPILFAAAYFTSWRDFRANARPIGLLAFGSVLFTTVAVAVVMKAVIPNLTWPAAFMLGAMISPPDASAATAITRKLGVPRRLLTIIEGESLVNGATALVAYRFAIAAALTGSFSLWRAAGRFVWVALGGVAVGLLVGAAGVWLFRRMQNPKAQTLLSFLAAFSAYSLGEHAGVSGVIATVAAGLYFGRWIPELATASLRIEARAVWDLILFAINSFVFTLIGLQLPAVMEELEYSWVALLFYAAILNAVVIAVRFLWVFSATYLPRRMFPSIARRDPAPPWQVITVLSWTGMRGIVSLAAALAIPQVLPHRPLLLFLTYTVILTTPLLPSLTLPWLLRRLGLRAGDENEREEALARLQMTEEAFQRLQELAGDARYRPEHLRWASERYERRLTTLRGNVSDQAFSPVSQEDLQWRRMLRELVALERQALRRIRHENLIHDDIFHQLSNELDLEDLRLRTQRL